MALIAGVMTAAGFLENVQTIIEDGKGFLEQVTVTDKETKTIPVHCNLASSFGTLNKESVKTMDKELKVMIAGTMRALGKLTDLKWKTVVACMMQNSLLEPMDGSCIMRSDKLIKKGINVFKTDGSPSQPIVNEVKSWFVKLIQDKDVLDDTKIDIDVLAKLVASTGALITSFETFFAKISYNERTVIDVGVLRYPDIENPYFKPEDEPDRFGSGYPKAIMENTEYTVDANLLTLCITECLHVNYFINSSRESGAVYF